MENINHFFECYFNQTCAYVDLDSTIDRYKRIESEKTLIDLISDLYKIIQTNNYELTSRIIKEYGARHLSAQKTEQLIKYIYDRLVNKTTSIKACDFNNKHKMIFCPICGTDKDNVCWDNLINKATVAGKDLQIFICKYCKVMWPTEDIRADNFQDYKKFMQTLKLKGTWKELCDVDFL